MLSVREKRSSAAWWSSYKWVGWLTFTFTSHLPQVFYYKRKVASVVKELVSLLRHLHFCLVTLFGSKAKGCGHSFSTTVAIGVESVHRQSISMCPREHTWGRHPLVGLPCQEHFHAFFSQAGKRKQETEDWEWGGLHPCTFSALCFIPQMDEERVTAAVTTTLIYWSQDRLEVVCLTSLLPETLTFFWML